MKDRTCGRSGLTLRWVPVKDKSGRVHMEARWTAPEAVAPRTAA
ncbi:hypothetical protein [Nocardioides limicola]|nr:hypothetical protein [Nocardioides sp. DJM-14]